MTWHHLDRRVSTLEQAQAEDHTEPEIIIRFGDEGNPLPPGTRVLHIELDGRPSWWETVGEEDDA